MVNCLPRGRTDVKAEIVIEIHQSKDKNLMFLLIQIDIMHDICYKRKKYENNCEKFIEFAHFLRRPRPVDGNAASVSLPTTVHCLKSS